VARESDAGGLPAGRFARLGQDDVREAAAGAGWCGAVVGRRRGFARHGRYGIDYPEHEYFSKEGPAVELVRHRMVDLLRAGRDVVLDHGLWRRGQRDEWKKLVEAAGGRWKLLYFPVPREELLRRLRARNAEADANALLVTESALDDFYARFDVPEGEGEQVVEAGSF
jgi:AAA domain-containing protein